MCKACTTGKYQSLSGQISCPFCAAGRFADLEGMSQCTACSAGSYLTGTGLSVCVPCQAGKFQGATGASVCPACPVGSSMPDYGQSACTLCVAGTFQNAVQQIACQACGYGRFTPDVGYSACLLCPVGKFSIFSEGTLCILCKAGEYQNAEGSIECKICLAGQFQTGVESSVCALCSPGTYQGATEKSTCIGCSAGTFRTGSGFTSCVACTACLSGQVWTSGCTATVDGVCGSCLAGTYVNAFGRFTCDACGAGTYQTGVRGVTCQSCRNCAAGTYQGTACLASADRVCPACQPGTYSSMTGLAACIGCENGRYQAGTGGTQCDACQTCIAGQSWGDSCQPTQNAVCTPCQIGTFNPSSQTSTCLRCAAGTYRDTVGGTVCGACATCTAGRYLASGCNGAENGRCETCTVCPQSTVQACGARIDTVCRTDSGVAWWRMTAYSQIVFQGAIAGNAPDLSLLPMVGSTFIQHVNLPSIAAFQAAIPGIPSNNFATAFELILTVVASGEYRICLQAFDLGFLDLDGLRLVSPWRSEICAVRQLTAGAHLVYGMQQQPSPAGVPSCIITYQGPDTNNLLVLMPKQLESLACTWSPTPYPWIGQDLLCRAGEYLVYYQASNASSRVCRPCPEGWAGPTGEYCERCKALEEPYFTDRSSCVCAWPATMNASGGCVCPDGFQQVGDGCAGCGLNAYGLDGLCWACSAGKYANTTGSTACQACEFGQYRMAGQTGGCLGCDLPGWFAPDASLGACVRCNASCAMDGWRWDRPCPGASGYSVCRECGAGLPPNASWSNWTECAFDCLAGFYRVEGGQCLACTQGRVCPAGRRLTNCAELADSHCDEACVDTNKPTIHSHWETGVNCPWACDYGYELRVWDYVMFQLRECALAGPTTCPVGRYYEDGQCFLCEAGTYQPITGGVCIACGPGRYSNTTGATTSGVCLACGAGTYSNTTVADGSGQCLACGAGTYSSGAGVTTSGVCLACGVGRYSSGAGATTSGVCLACGAGTYSSKMGATAVGACLACNVLSYAGTAGASTCSVCPASTYNTETGMSACASCQPPGGLAFFRRTVTFCSVCQNCRYYQMVNGVPSYQCDSAPGYGTIYVWMAGGAYNAHTNLGRLGTWFYLSGLGWDWGLSFTGGIYCAA